MIVYGKNVVEAILKSDRKIHQIYLDNKFSDQKLVSKLQKTNIKITYYNKNELNKLTNNGLHQGVALSIDAYKTLNINEFISEYAKDEKNIIMLDELQDPHNLGSIIRTCEAAGIKTIVISKNNQVPINSTVVKVSAGALEYVKIVEVTNINQAIKSLKETGYWIIGTSLDTDQSYQSIDRDIKKVFVFGNEGKGLRKLVSNNCDFLIKIPMMGHINSLNVGVSVGIVVYEYIDK